MSNTLTTISATLIQDEVLPALKLGLVPLNALSTRYVSDRPLSVGDTVKVNVVSAKSGGTFSSTFETGDSTVVGTSVTIGSPAFCSWYVDPLLEGMPTVERFLACGREAAYGVAKVVLQAVLAKFVTANIGDTDGTNCATLAASNYDVDDQADQWGYLKALGVRGNVSAIHNIAYATALLKDAALQDRSASGSDMLATGELPTILGMKQYYTDAFPSALTSENTGVIFTAPDAVAIAMGGGFVPDASAAAASSVREMPITDPDTGLTMVWRTWQNSATGIYWGAVYVMYGVAFLRASATRILSA